jgi:predicted lipid-binding transport protein (Tim44 family)
MDIIIFAIIAIVIFYKLNKQLGKIDEEEKRSIEDKVSLMRRMQDELLKKNSPNNQTQSSQQKLIGQSSTIQGLENLDEATKQNLEAIFASCNISYEFFINGAKSAFEMVLKAFCDGDISTLKMLLSEKNFLAFQKALNQRNVDQQKLTTNLIAIEKAEIISAITLENNASIVVKFVTKQINYICDKDDKVLDGKKDAINQITDIWTFKKDLTIANPNWIINATST